jgi:hypothetical protein
MYNVLQGLKLLLLFLVEHLHAPPQDLATELYDGTSWALVEI